MYGEGLLNGLNKEQKEAVEYTEGPLLILAGAGSGKTRVLTHRIGYLIEKGTAPWNILAITFTNKAAGEMRERVNGLLSGYDAGRVFVSTFHSMCVRLLRRDIDKLGYASDFTIYDTDDQKTLIKACIKKLNLDTKIYRERGVLSIISSNKNLMISAEDMENEAGDFYDRNVAKIYAEYEKELKANNALDFDDLLIKTVELFNEHPDVLLYWQERFKYIMVDEYQDTNNVQFELVRMLADKYKNLCVVGDDDQSIYKFRGANIENILNFEKAFPGAKVIKLEQNYRSTKSILNAANEVIKNNTGRKDKSLWTENETGELPVYNEYDTAAGEAESIIREALLMSESGYPLKDQAVLYRTNAQSRLLEEKCISRNIPYTIVGGVNFYQRREIKDILSYLRVISNGTDDVSCRRIINVPKRGIGQTTVDRVTAFSDINGGSFYEALLRPENIPGITSGTAKKIRAFTDYIENIRKRIAENELDITDAIRNIVNDTGYGDELKKEDPVTAETRLENIEELINKAADHQSSPENTTGALENADDGKIAEDESEVRPANGLSELSAFLEEVSLVADIDRMNDTDDVLTMMTLHSAKGLEFDVVYLSGMEEGLFPSAASINSDDPVAEIEEERRLCYVGITRARKKLFLSSARERMVNGEMHYMKPSRFIEEIPDSCAEKYFRRRTLSEKPAFSNFGGYEGRLEKELSYGSIGGTSFNGDERSSEERAYSAYNAFNTSSYRYGDKNGEAVFGRYGSLDTSAAGRGRKRSLSSISGLNKGQNMVKQKPDYGEGDRVRHFKFGDGSVISISDEPTDYKVTVEFDEYGTKVMYAGFAKLKKI